MNKDTIRKIRSMITSTSIPEEISALYLLASSVETISRDVYRRIRSIYAWNGIVCTDNALLSGMNSYCEAVKLATSRFYKDIEPQIDGVTFSLFYDPNKPDTAEEGANAYDNFSDDANEMCRLLLLYIDRTARNKESFEKVFTMIRDLPSCGIFKDEDISRFKQK